MLPWRLQRFVSELPRATLGQRSTRIRLKINHDPLRVCVRRHHRMNVGCSHMRCEKAPFTMNANSLDCVTDDLATFFIESKWLVPHQALFGLEPCRAC